MSRFAEAEGLYSISLPTFQSYLYLGWLKVGESQWRRVDIDLPILTEFTYHYPIGFYDSNGTFANCYKSWSFQNLNSYTSFTHILCKFLEKVFLKKVAKGLNPVRNLEGVKLTQIKKTRTKYWAKNFFHDMKYSINSWIIGGIFQSAVFTISWLVY